MMSSCMRRWPGFPGKARWRRTLEKVGIPAVGAEGGKLLYLNGRLQHAGIVIGVIGRATHFNLKTALRLRPAKPSFQLSSRSYLLLSHGEQCLVVEKSKKRSSTL